MPKRITILRNFKHKNKHCTNCYNDYPRIMKKSILPLLTAIFTLCTLVYTAGCKQPEKPKVKIIAQDESNNKLTGAKIELICTPEAGKTCREELIGLEGETDETGSVEFEFDQTVVMEISATFPNKAGGDSLAGKGFLQAEFDETDEVIVILAAI